MEELHQGLSHALMLGVGRQLRSLLMTREFAYSAPPRSPGTAALTVQHSPSLTSLLPRALPSPHWHHPEGKLPPEAPQGADGGDAGGQVRVS